MLIMKHKHKICPKQHIYINHEIILLNDHIIEYSESKKIQKRYIDRLT